jgi:hypothetical protein
MCEKMTEGKKQIYLTPWAIIVGLLIGTMILVVVYAYTKQTAEILLSGLLIVGVISLILALCLFAMVFKSFGLADKKNTLGLPEGSVRAVIALTLILLFMMSSVFLYNQVNVWGQGKPYQSTNITQEILDSYPKEEVVAVSLVGTFNNETRYNVTRLVTGNTEASENLAQQLITILGTLVAAISAFYFGTKAVEGTKGSSDPVLTKIVPNAMTKGEEGTITLYGENLNQVKEVRLAQGSKVAIYTDLTSSSTKISTKVKTADLDAGKWTVVVSNSDGKEDQLENALEVKTG